MNTVFSKVRTLTLALALANAAIAGCSSTDNHVPGEGASDVGGIGFNLTLPGGVVINTVSYTLTAPGYSKTGSFSVTGPGNTFTASITGVPAGSGYVLALTGVSADGARTCTGTSAAFTVTGGVTTPVTVGLKCPGLHNTGTVLVNGSVNICAVVDSAFAGASSVAVGSTTALTGSVSDEDGGPSAPTYAWSSSSSAVATISGATTASATLTCASAGTVTVSLTTTDSDCGEASTFSITCTGGGTAGTGAAGTGAAGTGAAGTGAAGTGAAGTGAAGTGAAGTGAAGTGAAGTGAAGTGAAGTGSTVDACTTCEQGNTTCNMRLSDCNNIAGSVNGVLRSDLCKSVLSCVRTTKCAITTGGVADCFCGPNADIGACSAATSLSAVNGSCKNEIATALETTTVSDINARLVDPSYAGGLALRLVQCDARFCSTVPACGLTP